MKEILKRIIKNMNSKVVLVMTHPFYGRGLRVKKEELLDVIETMENVKLDNMGDLVIECESVPFADDGRSFRIIDIKVLEKVKEYW